MRSMETARVATTIQGIDAAPSCMVVATFAVSMCLAFAMLRY